MIFLGIDPGCPLTICVDDTRKQAPYFWEADAVAEQIKKGKGKRWENDPRLISARLRELCVGKGRDMFAILEQVGPRPGQGLVSTTRFVGSMYLMQGLLTALQIPFLSVPPATWKRALGKLSSDKEKSRARAIAEVHPNHVGLFARKKDHNRAEAYLLALYAEDRYHGKA